MKANKKNQPLKVELNLDCALPQAIDIEEIVLGTLMLEAGTIENVQGLLEPDTFYAPGNKMIFEAIQQLYIQSSPIDIITVTKELEKRGDLETVGGPYHITKLTNRIASGSNIQYHAGILMQKHLSRKLIQSCSEIITSAYEADTDPFELLDHAEGLISNITSKLTGNTMLPLREILVSAYEIQKRRCELVKAGNSLGIDTGIMDLNKLTGGWQNGDLIILAARPGMGKSAMMLHYALSAAQSNVPVCIFSLEMPNIDLADRLTLTESHIDPDNFRLSRLTNDDWESYNKAINQLMPLSIFIDPNPIMSMQKIKAKCRTMKKSGKCAMIFIDYLQLMDMNNGKSNRNREQEVAEASRQAKIIAKELDIPVMLLCQLSRKVEERKLCKPSLSDLRESGAIEQDADIVMLMYRPEYYGYDEDSVGNDLKGYGEILIEKHRNGPTGLVKFHYNSSLSEISDYEK